MSIDVGYSFHANGYSPMVMDIALDDTGDVVSVAHEEACLQNLLVWLLTTPGDNPLSPTWGNPLISLLQSPVTQASDYADIFTQAQMNYVAEQDVDIAIGLMSPSYRITSFTDTAVDLSRPPLISIKTIVHFAHNRSLPFHVSLPLGG